jgi:DNA-binding transcriptional LysR family regulator
MFESAFSRKGLSLERLRRFCEVAHAGSIAQAEESNRRVQSSYSRDIMALESYFGFRLFGREIGRSRSGHRMSTLTPQGRALQTMAMDIFHRIEDFRDFSETPKRIRLGGGETVMHWVVGSHLPAITAAMRNTTVEIKDHNSQEESLAALHDGRLDYAIVEESATASVPFRQRAHALGTLTFSLFVHPDALGRARRSAQARLLGQIPWIALSDARKATTEAIADMEKAGVTVHLAATLTNFRQATTALRGRRLAALLPSVARADMARMGFEPIDLPALQHLSVPISLLYNEEQQTMRPYLAATAETLVRVMVPLDAGNSDQAQ